MTAAQVVARPWPLRIPPNPPESWFGYINRLASTYLCTPATLMASISPAGVRQHPHTGRALGMLATDDTLTKISHQFSLTAHEARGLFLMRYQPFLQISEQDRARADPASAARTTSFPQARRSGVRGNQDRYRCRLCQDEDPTRWDLSWLLRLHLICTDHAITLTNRAGAEPDPIPVSSAAVEAQLQVLHALEEPGANAAQLRQWAASYAGVHNPTPADLIHALEPPPPPSPAETRPTPPRRPLNRRIGSSPAVLGVALRAGYTPNDPQVIELAKGASPTLAALLVRYHQPQRTSPQHRRADHLARYPLLVPVRIYYGDLSDLTYPLDLWLGRRLARLAIQMHDTGCTTADACAQLGMRKMRDLARLQARLEAEGRLERYWDAVSQASDALRHDPTDYQRRRRLIEDGTAPREAAQAQADLRLDRPPMKRWLVDRWANHWQTGNFPFGDIPKLDRFDLTYGHHITEFLAPIEQASSA